MAENSTSAGHSDTDSSTMRRVRSMTSGAGGAHLVLQVDVGGGDEGVDAGPLGVLDGVPAGADVALHAARQSADDRALDLPGDGAHRLEVAGAAGREAGLDDVHPQPGELVRDLQLLRRVEAAARRLLAVAQRGVEEDDRLAYVAAARPAAAGRRVVGSGHSSTS